MRLTLMLRAYISSVQKLRQWVTLPHLTYFTLVLVTTKQVHFDKDFQSVSMLLLNILSQPVIETEQTTTNGNAMITTNSINKSCIRRKRLEFSF